MSISRTAMLLAAIISHISVFGGDIKGNVQVLKAENQLTGKTQPLANILVSNGYSIAKTDENGSFTLPDGLPIKYISVVLPNGYSAWPFFIPYEKGRQSYDFVLQEQPNPVKKEFSFCLAGISGSNNGYAVQAVKQITEGRNPLFFITTGRHLSFNDSVTAPVFQSGVSATPEFPELYSFAKGAVQLAIVTNNATSDKISDWMKSLLGNITPQTPLIVVSNSKNLTYKNGLLYVGKEKISLSGYNLKCFIDGNSLDNLYDYKGKLEPSFISVSPLDKGSNLQGYASFREVYVSEKNEVSSECIPYGVPASAVIVSPQVAVKPENGKIRIYVNAFSSSKPVTKVKVGISRGNGAFSWSDLNNSSAWCWSGFINCEYLPTGEYVLKAIAQSGYEEIASNEQKVTITTAVKDSLAVQSPANNDTRPAQMPLLLHRFTVNAMGTATAENLATSDSIIVTAGKNERLNGKYTLTAINLKTGKNCWRFYTKGEITGRIVTQKGKAIAADNLGNVYALNIHTGTLSWSTSIEKVNGTKQATAIDPEDLYIRQNMGTIVAFDVSSGKPIWNISGDYTDDIGISVSSKSALVVDSKAATCIDKVSGKVLWKHNLPSGELCSKTATYADGMYQVAGAGSIISLKEQDGTATAAALPINGELSSPPLCKDNLVYVGTYDNGVTAIDLNSKKTLWSLSPDPAMVYTHPTGAHQKNGALLSSPLIYKEFLIYGSTDGYLNVVKRDSGVVLQRINLGAPVFISPIIVNGMLIVTDLSGNVAIYQLAT